MPPRVPLSSRLIDFLYLVFFLVRMLGSWPQSLKISTNQRNRSTYPQHSTPKVLRDTSEWYIMGLLGDSLITGAFYGGAEFN